MDEARKPPADAKPSSPRRKKWKPHSMLISPSYVAHRSDVDEVLESFRRNGAETITIEDEDYLYETVDALVAHRGKRPANVRLAASWSDVTLSVRFHKSLSVERVLFENKPLESAVSTAWEDVLAVYSRCRMSTERAAGRSWPLILAGGLLATATYAAVGDMLPTWAALAVAVGVTTAVNLGVHAISFSATWIDRMLGFGLVLELPHERSTFWRRNGDKVLLGLVTFVLGGILTKVWELLTQ